MTLRLPLELREAITEEARVKGDLARIILFALSHVERKEIEIQRIRKAGYYTGGKDWRSNDGTSRDEVAQGFEGLCTNRVNGPCSVKTWEIVDKTCHDE